MREDSRVRSKATAAMAPMMNTGAIEIGGCTAAKIAALATTASAGRRV